jgi:hypothetical protein
VDLMKKVRALGRKATSDSVEEEVDDNSEDKKGEEEKEEEDDEEKEELQKGIVCSVCGVTKESNPALNRHYRSVHLRIKGRDSPNLKHHF